MLQLNICGLLVKNKHGLQSHSANVFLACTHYAMHKCPQDPKQL